MASKRVGITVAWLAATASATMLAVPVASGSWRDADGRPAAADSGGSREEGADDDSADRCVLDRPWTHVPVDSRLDAAAAGARADGSVVSTVVGVPRTAVVRVDRRGRAVAAWTNTGCPPRPGDEVWVERDDGSLILSTDGALSSRWWTGDFTVPGVWVRQTGAAAASTVDA